MDKIKVDVNTFVSNNVAVKIGGTEYTHKVKSSQGYWVFAKKSGKKILVWNPETEKQAEGIE